MNNVASTSTRKEKLLARLKELGTDPKRSLGQNFLISDHVIDRILFAVKSEPFSSLIEVGPGLGALTEDLIGVAREKSSELVVIELDRKFAEYWRERSQVSMLPTRIHEGDALRLNWSSLELKDQSLFVSNLPYQISSSLVIDRSIAPAGITRMILMFQKEVAQRLAARARTEDYGLLTVVAQTFWEISTVCEAGPKDFYPPPNVASRVLMFKRRKQISLLESGVNKASAFGFLKFVKAAFSHRRKLLARNLMGQFLPPSVSLPEIEALFALHTLLPTARAEELDPAAFVGLYLEFVKKGWTSNG